MHNVKITYQGGVNRDFEEDIEKVMVKHGFEFWASSKGSEGDRDLAYDLPENINKGVPCET